jgi:hypothetical protein
MKNLFMIALIYSSMSWAVAKTTVSIDPQNRFALVAVQNFMWDQDEMADKLYESLVAGEEFQTPDQTFLVQCRQAGSIKMTSCNFTIKPGSNTKISREDERTEVRLLDQEAADFAANFDLTAGPLTFEDRHNKVGFYISEKKIVFKAHLKLLKP